MKRIISLLFLTLLLTACGTNATVNDAANASPDGNESTSEHSNANEQDNKEKQSSMKKVEQNSYDEPIIKEKDYAIDPKRIKIPAIGVDASIEDVGLLDNGQMGVPADDRNVGWYEPGVQPGAKGNSVLAGHVDNKTGPAVFFYLKKLKAGDEVIIEGENGETLTFEVLDKKVFPMDDAPVDKIFGYSSRRALNLITCTGPFEREKGGHIDRLVVYTQLKSSSF